MAPSWAICLHALKKLLALHGVQLAHPAEMLRRKGGDALELEFLLGAAQGVADGEDARIEHADDIPGVGLLDDLAVLAAMSCWGWDRRIFAALDMVDLHSASNRPEQIRMKAMRSRWALFMLAWILNTKAEKSSSRESTTSSPARRGRGAVVICRKCSRKGSTPKLVRAEPKNTRESLPWRTRSMSNSAAAPSSSSISSESCAVEPLDDERPGWDVPARPRGVAALAPPLEVKWIILRLPGHIRPGSPCRSRWASSPG